MTDKVGWSRAIRDFYKNYFCYFLYLLFGVSLVLLGLESFVHFKPLPPNPCSEKLIDASFEGFKAGVTSHILPCPMAAVLNGHIVGGMFDRLNYTVAQCGKTKDHAKLRRDLVWPVLEYQAALARLDRPPSREVEDAVVSMFSEMAGEWCMMPATSTDIWNAFFPTIHLTEPEEGAPKKDRMRTMLHIYRVSLLFFFLQSEYRPQVLKKAMALNFDILLADKYVRKYEELLLHNPPLDLLHQLSDKEDEVQFDFLTRLGYTLMLAMNRMVHCEPYPGDDWPSYLERALDSIVNEHMPLGDCAFNKRPFWPALLEWTDYLSAWQREHAPLFRLWLFTVLLAVVVVFSGAALGGKAGVVLGAYTALSLSHAFYLLSWNSQKLWASFIFFIVFNTSIWFLFQYTIRNEEERAAAKAKEERAAAAKAQAEKAAAAKAEKKKAAQEAKAAKDAKAKAAKKK